MGAGTFVARSGYWIFFAFLTICMLSPSMNVEGEGQGDYPPPENGDWVIANNTFVSNETIILNGNLKVKNNSSLTLENTTLIFNSTSSGYIGIVIEHGSFLNITHSNITSISGFYTFDVIGNMVMQNSLVSRMTGGIFIDTGNVTIDNCMIFNNYDFAIAGFGNPVISNNTIHSNYGGILTGFGSAPIIYNNTIFSNDWGITCNSFGFAKIIGNNIYNNSLGGITVELGHMYIHDNIISSNGGFGIHSDHALIDATNNLIFDNERWGIYSLGAQINEENNYFESNGKFNGEGDILQEWEIVFHVFDTGGSSVDDVNITIYDRHDDFIESANTAGNVRKFTLREYESRDNGTLLVHNPFKILVRKDGHSNTTELNINASEMDVIELNTFVIFLDIEEEPDKEVGKYVFPVWGSIVVLGIWVLALIMIIIGIVVTLSHRKKRGV